MSFDSEGRGKRIGQELSHREKQVLSCLALGMVNKEICSTLCLASGTVKNHCSRIYDKTDTDSGLTAVLYAVRLGIIPLEEEKLWETIKAKPTT